MKTSAISYGSQIRRLREVAEAVLAHYDLGNTRLSLLSNRATTLFQVLASPVLRQSSVAIDLVYDEEGEEELHEEHEGLEERTTIDVPHLSMVEMAKGIDEASTVEEQMGRRTRSRFVLRLYREQAVNLAVVQSELQWLTSLHRDASLGVPAPIAARNGSLITEVEIEGFVGKRQGVLFQWVEGRFVDSGLSPTYLERVGILMGRLHQHARTYVPPAGFIRPRQDWRMFLSSALLGNADYGRDLLSAEDHVLLGRAAEKIREKMRSIPQDIDNFGLIHFDLQQTNYLFYKDEARVINFEDCCWGYYLFDIAITLSGILNRPAEEAMRNAFFKGYERIRPLPPHYEERLPVFTALRLFKRLNYLLRFEYPGQQAQRAEWLPLILDWMRAFVESK